MWLKLDSCKLLLFCCLLLFASCLFYVIFHLAYIFILMIHNCLPQMSIQMNLKVIMLFLWWFFCLFWFLTTSTELTGDFRPAAFLFSLLFFDPERLHLLEMAHLPYRRHGNFPRRQATLFPLALDAISSETDSYPATAAEEPSVPAEHVIHTQIELQNNTAKTAGVAEACQTVTEICLNYWYDEM